VAWIESHEELPTHPKTRKLARRLNVGVPTVIGHLHMLWWWCLTHRPDGVLYDMDAEDIADAAGWIDNPVAFVDAMFDAGWLDDNGDALQVHDWWDGAGKTIQRRKYSTERQRRKRDREQDSDQTDDSHAAVTRDTQTGHVVDSDSDRDRDKEVKPVVSRKRATQATVLPQGWTPTPEPDLIRAVGGQKTADRELDKFRDYWIAQPGAKGRKKDWQATWRNWLRNSQDFKQRGSPPEPAQVSKPVVGSDDWQQREERQRELERRFLDGVNEEPV
jgi:hypothetical protein